MLSAAFQQAGQETLDVVVLPEPTNGTPFSVPFQAVGPDSLAVGGPAPDRPVPTTAPSFAPNPPAPAASYGSNGSPRPAGSSSRPSPGNPSPGGGQPSASAAGGGGGGTATPPTSGGGGIERVASVFDEAPSWARLVATVLLGLVAVAMAAASSDKVRAAVPALQRLAGAGAPMDRGVGRFARTRDGRPPALS